MRRSVRILGLVQEQIPGSVLCGDFLAVGKTQMFLRSPFDGSAEKSQRFISKSDATLAAA
ncbi:MAG: hypothetical protein ACTHLY_01580 [Pseudolabrys sp.]|jgi:hypothetical protein